MQMKGLQWVKGKVTLSEHKYAFRHKVQARTKLEDYFTSTVGTTWFLQWVFTSIVQQPHHFTSLSHKITSGGGNRDFLSLEVVKLHCCHFVMYKTWDLSMGEAWEYLPRVSIIANCSLSIRFGRSSSSSLYGVLATCLLHSEMLTIHCSHGRNQDIHH